MKSLMTRKRNFFCCRPLPAALLRRRRDPVRRKWVLYSCSINTAPLLHSILLRTGICFPFGCSVENTELFISFPFPL